MYGERLPGATRGAPPCKECEERHTACWDSCPKYKEWQAEVHRINEARNAYVKSRHNDYVERNRRNGWQRRTF